MKTQRRRGFTVVELVVVIAIIAVLAAVLIPTFTSIIKKANDSAALQERTNQRLEDIAQKVDNANWLSWEDFEAKLAAEIAKIGKVPTDDEIKAAVKAAMDQYAASQGTGETGLTKDQVEIIVKEALSGQLTSAQVEAIVRSAIAQNPSTSGLTEAQVKQIVNSAVAGIKQTGVTKTEMQKAITEALNGIDTGLTEGQVSAIVANALKGFSTLTEEKVNEIVTDAINGLDQWIYFASDRTVATESALDSATATYVLRTDATLGKIDIESTGVTIKRLIIDAPNVQTVNVNCDVTTLEIQRTASTSTHIKGSVTTLVINKGRAVVEAGATVATLTAAPSTNAKVTVVISGAVTTLNAQYQDNGTGTNDTIEIINAGSVGTSNLTASEALEASGTTTTNVQVTNIAGATNPVNTETLATTASVAITESELSVNTATSVENAESNNYATTTTVPVGNTQYANSVARIGSTGYASLSAAVAAAKDGETVILLKDTTENNITVVKSITIDGNGKTLYDSSTGTNGRAIWIDTDNITLTVKNLTIDGMNKCQRGIQVNTGLADNFYDAVLNIDNCVLKNLTTYAINFCKYTSVDMTLTNSSVTGWAAINAYGTGNLISVKNCTLEGINPYSSLSNDFSTICLEGDTTGRTDDHSSDYEIVVENSTIKATRTGTNNQALIGFNKQSVNSSVTIKNCELIVGDGCKFSYNNGTDNTLTWVDSTLNGSVIPDPQSEDIDYQIELLIGNAVAYKYMSNEIETTDGYYNFNRLIASSNMVGSYYKNTYGASYAYYYFCDGEWLELLQNVTVTKSQTLNMNVNSVGTLGIVLGEYSLDLASGVTLTIPVGVTIATDKSVDIFSAPNGYTIVESPITENDTYHYSYTVVADE